MANWDKRRSGSGGGKTTTALGTLKRIKRKGKRYGKIDSILLNSRWVAKYVNLLGDQRLVF